MNLSYEVIDEGQIELCKDLCNELMAFQKEKANIKQELFDSMNFETRMVPSVKKAIHNYIVVVKDEGKIVGYVYSNISPKEVYSSEFATYFYLNSVHKSNVGCLSQFYIKKDYRKYGVGSVLFNMSLEWLKQFNDVKDYFIFVSNGNEDALAFYQRKGFSVSHSILDGFITVLRAESKKKQANNEHVKS